MYGCVYGCAWMHVCICIGVSVMCVCIGMVVHGWMDG